MVILLPAPVDTGQYPETHLVMASAGAVGGHGGDCHYLRGGASNAAKQLTMHKTASYQKNTWSQSAKFEDPTLRGQELHVF